MGDFAQAHLLFAVTHTQKVYFARRSRNWINVAAYHLHPSRSRSCAGIAPPPLDEPTDWQARPGLAASARPRPPPLAGRAPTQLSGRRARRAAGWSAFSIGFEALKETGDELRMPCTPPERRHAAFGQLGGNAAQRQALLFQIAEDGR
jgi:hypothetical protein